MTDITDVRYTKHLEDKIIQLEQEIKDLEAKFDIVDIKTDKTILRAVSYEQANKQLKSLNNDRYMIVAT